MDEYGDGVPAGVETVADLVAAPPGETPPAGPGETAPALSVAGDDVPVEYDGEGLRADACKTANLLAHLGVRSGRTLAVADDSLPQPVLGLLGAAVLGAVVRFVPADPGALAVEADDRDAPGSGHLDARAVLAPGDVVTGYPLPPGGQAVGYGTDPGDPAATYFEKEMWSENATVPPPTVAPGDPLLVAGGERYAHGEVLRAAAAVAGAHDLGPGDRVAMRASFRVPGAVVAGVVAPLLAGAAVVLARGIDRSVGRLAVATGAAPEAETVAPEAVAIPSGDG